MEKNYFFDNVLEFAVKILIPIIIIILILYSLATLFRIIFPTERDRFEITECRDGVVIINEAINISKDKWKLVSSTTQDRFNGWLFVPKNYVGQYVLFENNYDQI